MYDLIVEDNISSDEDNNDEEIDISVVGTTGTKCASLRGYETVIYATP